MRIIKKHILTELNNIIKRCKMYFEQPKEIFEAIGQYAFKDIARDIEFLINDIIDIKFKPESSNIRWYVIKWEKKNDKLTK